MAFGVDTTEALNKINWPDFHNWKGQYPQWARSLGRRRTAVAAAASVALALAVSACGTSGSTSGASPTATSAPAANSASRSSGGGSTGSPPQGTATPSSTTTAAASDQSIACTTSDLRFHFDRTTGTAGTELLVFSVRNTTAQSCDLAGYFGISLYSSAGRLLTGTDHRKAATPGGVPAHSTTVTLKPDGEATTATAFSDNAPTGSGVTCTKVAAAQLIPPNQTSQAAVPIPRSSQPMFCGSPRAPIDVFVTRPGPPPANYR